MRARAATLLLAGAVTLGLLPASATASPSPGTTDRPRDLGTPAVVGSTVAGDLVGAGQSDAATPAEAADEALAAAKALFTGRTGPSRRTGSGDGARETGASGDATMVLRELRMRYDDLSAAEQEQARALLLRPTTNGPQDPDYWWDIRYGMPAQNTCEPEAATGAHLCVHWVDSGEHAPDTSNDGDGDGTPDQVELTAATFAQVWAKEVGQMGYRAPLDDSASEDPGPNGLLDVYLVNLPKDTYGFCVPEATSLEQARVPGYCAVDNDFTDFERPTNALKATAAHEFFHSVQFAYDWLEDAWMMESTATWIEDEVFDGVNDNLQYLPASTLRYPFLPLDQPELVYGSWIFWRFLSEYTAGPVVVRETWQRAAGEPYSLQAVRRMLDARGRSFTKVFAEFGATSRYAKAFYDEGATYRNAPAETIRLTASRREISGYAEMKHLSHLHLAFKPGDTLRGTWRLRIRLALPARLRGSAATVVLTTRAGARKRYAVRLDRRGDDTLTVPFSRRSVAAVTLTLTNASTRMANCWTEPVSSWSCLGDPRDEGLRYNLAVRAIR